MKTLQATLLHSVLGAGVLLLCACPPSDSGKDSEDTDTGDTDTDSGGTDADGDGWTVEAGDCDDGDVAVHPEAPEACDGQDNDCDSLVDDEDELAAGEGTVYHRDDDDDGYGQDEATTRACAQPAGYAEQGDDCDDDDAAVHPGAAEVDCTDPVDYNCDGTTGYADGDADGWAACEDCADDDAAINPGAAEVCGGADEDCDSLVDDEDPSVSDAVDWYADADGDGWAPDASEAVTACAQPPGHVAQRGDCDDGDAAVSPDGVEVCDDLDADEDCDGDADDADAGVDPSGFSSFWEDDDADGHGDAADETRACDLPAGYAGDALDCDDGDAGIHPDAEEVCDGVDQDCDGETDEEAVDGDWYAPDEDGDGFGAAGELAWACSGAADDWDCDDADASEPVVVDAASGSPGGAGTASSPLDSVQAGVDQADTCVVVRAGSYAEAVDLGGKALSLRAVDGPDLTTLDATGLGEAAVRFVGGEGEDTVLSGFTLTGDGHLEESSNSYACGSESTCTDYYAVWCGGAIYAESSDPTIRDVVLRDSALPEDSTSTVGDDTWYVNSLGGAACFVDSAPLLRGLRVSGNFASTGGAIFADESSRLSLEQASFLGNEAAVGGAIFSDGGELILQNVLVAANGATASAGGVGVAGGTLTAINVTVAENDAPEGGALWVDTTGTVSLSSCILSSESASTATVETGGGVIGAAYTDVYNPSGSAWGGMTDPTGSDGNLSVDPGFVGAGDFHLAEGSACIDAGDPAGVDFDGTVTDMGAFGGPAGSW